MVTGDACKGDELRILALRGALSVILGAVIEVSKAARKSKVLGTLICERLPGHEKGFFTSFREVGGILA